LQSTLKRLIAAIEFISEWSGRAVAWLVLAMVLVIAYDVAMRYLFQTGSVALQELEWHLFALLFLLGAAYTLKHDSHVRVDIFYNSQWMTDRRRAMIDLFGGLFLLLPFCLMIIISSLPFVANSYGLARAHPTPAACRTASCSRRRSPWDSACCCCRAWPACCAAFPSC